MKGRNAFTEKELGEIRDLLNLKIRSDKPNQKQCRDRLRRMGFYITDYDQSRKGFCSTDLDELIRTKKITVN